MRVATYWLTFLAHALSNGMRASYAFNKVYIMEALGVSELLLGLMDMILLFSIGVGCMLRFELVQGHDLKLIFLKGSIASSVGAAILPFFSYWYTSSTQLSISHNSLVVYSIMVLSFVGVGLYKFSCFPIMATLMSKYYSSKKDGCMFGFWMSSWLWGCIACLVLCNFVVVQLQCRWEVSLILIAMSYVMIGLFIYWTLENPEQYSKSKQQTTSREFFEFFQVVICRFDIQVFFLLVIFGATSYFILVFWLPLFFHSSGYGDVAGYMTTLLYLASILGTFIFGWLYQLRHHRVERIRSSNQDRQTLNVQYSSSNPLQKVGDFSLGHIGEISVVVSIICCLFLIKMKTNSLLAYGLIVFTLGFFLGGAFNTLRLKDLCEFFEFEIHSRQLFSYLTLAIEQTFVGIFQFIMGIVLRAANSRSNNRAEENMNFENFSDDSQRNGRYFEIFYVLIVTLSLYGLVFIIRSVFVRKKTTESNQQQELQEQKFETRRLVREE